jgi:hypothetical protein
MTCSATQSIAPQKKEWIASSQALLAMTWFDYQTAEGSKNDLPVGQFEQILLHHLLIGYLSAPFQLSEVCNTARQFFPASQSGRTKIQIENAMCSSSTQIRGDTECDKNERLITAMGSRLAITFSFR